MLVEGSPTTLLIGFAARSKWQRVLILMLFVLLLLVAMENLQIIPTYLK